MVTLLLMLNSHGKPMASVKAGKLLTVVFNFAAEGGALQYLKPSVVWQKNK